MNLREPIVVSNTIAGIRPIHFFPLEDERATVTARIGVPNGIKNLVAVVGVVVDLAVVVVVDAAVSTDHAEEEVATTDLVVVTDIEILPHLKSVDLRVGDRLKK